MDSERKAVTNKDSKLLFICLNYLLLSSPVFTVNF